jgi:hypothetical protein
MTNKFFIKENGKLKAVKNIETYGYYLSGFADPNDKGKLHTLQFIDNCGTCLVPVYDQKGQEIVNTDKAGLYYSQTTPKQ